MWGTGAELVDVSLPSGPPFNKERLVRVGMMNLILNTPTSFFLIFNFPGWDKSCKDTLFNFDLFHIPADMLHEGWQE